MCVESPSSPGPGRSEWPGEGGREEEGEKVRSWKGGREWEKGGKEGGKRGKEGREGGKEGGERGRGPVYLGVIDQPDVGLALFHRLAEDGDLRREGGRQGKRKGQT